ncbi:MAG: thiamine phosphate synthase, partial [Candidatus Binatia bacterium]
MPLTLPPLYAILDPEQTKGRPAERVLQQLLEGGAKILQLRVKAMMPREFLALARVARKQTRAAGCQLIVN